MPTLSLSFASGETSLSVRRFSVREAVSELYVVSVWARSPSQDIDLETIVGQQASFHIQNGRSSVKPDPSWDGICSHFELVQTEPTGLATYFLRIVPSLWLLTQRRDHRVFQHLSIPDIIDAVLADWSVSAAWKIDRGKYPKLEYKVQYDETDFDFVRRLLEEAGIAFTFPDGAAFTPSDALHKGKPRSGTLVFADNPSRAVSNEFVTQVRLWHDVLPGAYTIRDYDFRNPNFPLFGEAPKAAAPENKYEQYRYQPGAFLVETTGGGDTPVADDQAVARYDQTAGAARAGRALAGERTGKRAISFTTNVVDLSPGAIFSIDHHPHSELSASALLLVTELQLDGTEGEEWSHTGHAVFAELPHLPQIRTPKPRAGGVQSALVVGPSGQEIHTDEFGRVRVQFPWDRKGKKDDHSSCWIRVSHAWAGAGFGVITTPRVGQEVLVGFLEADPDQPIVVGRVYNAKNPVPYKLPDHKTRSTWKTDSSPGSNGFNEILFEDLAGQELVYVQAQKNLRRLVKNDETITIGNDRQKLVKRNETETTQGDRIEVTAGNRTEITDKNRVTIISGDLGKLVKGSETERIGGDHLLTVDQDQHLIVKKTKRERVEKSSHLTVVQAYNQQIGGTHSISVGGDQEEKVGKNHALETGAELHLKAGTALVIEAVSDLTLKGPGGFVRIDASGVTIVGIMVKINSGGSPGSGSPASPAGADKPKEAEVPEPAKPTPDDVSKTGLAQ
jgi:type VI secretion system secreted protein VgrG